MIPDALFRLITAAAIAFLPVLITVVRLRRRAVAQGKSQRSPEATASAAVSMSERPRSGRVRRWLERQGVHLLGDPEVVPPPPAAPSAPPAPGYSASSGPGHQAKTVRPAPQRSREAGQSQKKTAPSQFSPPRSRLGQLTELQRALVWSEVLGPPKGLRPDPFSPARPDGE